MPPRGGPPSSPHGSSVAAASDEASLDSVALLSAASSVALLSAASTTTPESNVIGGRHRQATGSNPGAGQGMIAQLSLPEVSLPAHAIPTKTSGSGAERRTIRSKSRRRLPWRMRDSYLGVHQGACHGEPSGATAAG